ncbi:hypothetical protein B0H12DRAFT_1073053 [Mycena haematopus]|nr:hypothetical protein B0H12DRAFT_1073053 [Mycena haematopus]
MPCVQSSQARERIHPAFCLFLLKPLALSSASKHSPKLHRLPEMTYSNINQPIPPFISDNSSQDWTAWNWDIPGDSSSLYTMDGSTEFQIPSNKRNLSLSSSGRQEVMSMQAAIASASHFDLLSAQNQAYKNLLDSYNNLFEQYNKLRLSFVQHTSSSSQPVSSIVPNVPSRASATSLATTASSLFSVNPGALVLADRKEYPDVVFWTRRRFNESQKTKAVATMNSMPGKRGRSRAAQDINVMTQYLEKTDGSIVSGNEAATIRATQITIWNQILQTSPSNLPRTWKQASITVVNYHRAELYTAYPLLRLCESHWKADLLATTSYPSWYKKNVKSKSKSTKPAKRPAADSSDSEDSDSDDGSDVDDDPQDLLNDDNNSPSSSSSTPSALVPKKRKKNFAPSTQAKKPKTTVATPSSSTQSPTTTPDPTPDPFPPSSLSPLEPTPPLLPPRCSSPSSQSPAEPIAQTPAPTSEPDSSIPSTDPHPTPVATANTNGDADTNTNPDPIENTNSVPRPRGVGDVVEGGADAHETNSPANTNAGSGANHTAVKPTVLVNPLDAEFGPASGPTARSEAAAAALTKTATKATTKPQAKKKLQKSSSPGNLFYAEFLKTHDAVTPKEFEKIWEELPAETRTTWKTRSKAINAAKKASKSQAAAAASEISQTWLMRWADLTITRAAYLDRAGIGSGGQHSVAYERGWGGRSGSAVQHGSTAAARKRAGRRAAGSRQQAAGRRGAGGQAGSGQRAAGRRAAGSGQRAGGVRARVHWGSQ